jgi:hypothetical protein
VSGSTSCPRRAEAEDSSFATDDAQKSCEELESRGVEFTQEPSEQPYGIESAGKRRTPITRPGDQ